MKKNVTFAAMKRLWHLIRQLLRLLSPRRRATEPEPSAVTPRREGGCRIVAGAAATGKTAMMRAQAAEEMGRPGSRVMAITASELAASPLTSLPAYQPGCHFAGTARALCCMIIGAGECSADEDILGRALTAFESRGDILPRFDTILVDDAQNLSPSMIRLIGALAHPDGCAVTYFIDPGQAIFSFAGATADTLALLRAQAGHRIARLNERRRPVGHIAATLTAPDSDGAARLAAATAAEILGREGGSVGIITRTNAEAAGAAAALSERGVGHLLLTARLTAADAEDDASSAEPWRRWAVREADLRPTPSAGITIATAHTARDREMDHVVVLATASERTPEEERRLATAISRSRLSATLVTLG